MSGYVGEAAVVRAWFEAEWESGVPIHLLENTPFPEKPNDAPWARLSVRSREGQPATIGGPNVTYRHDGDIIVEIFAPDGTGDGRARELADLACSIIRGREEGGLVVWRARAIPLGVQDGWYRMTAIGPFSRDEDFNVHS